MELTGEIRNVSKILSENMKEIDNFEEIMMDGRILLKRLAQGIVQ
jgi:predicted amino acid-binding ACT domain protein